MTILTNTAKNLIANATINKLDIFITKVVYADCNLDNLDENTLDLANIKYENAPTSVRINDYNNSQIILEAVLKNDTLNDFFINCVGFYTSDNKLFCFSKINRTFVQSANNNKNASYFQYKLVIEPENTSNLSIKIDESIVYVTNETFNTSQKVQDELISKKADKIDLEKYYLNHKGEELHDRLIKTEAYCNDLNDKKANKSTTYTKEECNNLLNTKANNTEVVLLNNAQVINGVKTFNSVPRCKLNANSNDMMVNWQTLQEQLNLRAKRVYFKMIINETGEDFKKKLVNKTIKLSNGGFIQIKAPSDFGYLVAIINIPIHLKARVLNHRNNTIGDAGYFSVWQLSGVVANPVLLNLKNSIGNLGNSSKHCIIGSQYVNGTVSCLPFADFYPAPHNGANIFNASFSATGSIYLLIGDTKSDLGSDDFISILIEEEF